MKTRPISGRTYGLPLWTAFLDSHARSIFGISGEEFEARYEAGTFGIGTVADDLGSILPLIRRLCVKAGESGEKRRRPTGCKPMSRHTTTRNYVRMRGLEPPRGLTHKTLKRVRCLEFRLVTCGELGFGDGFLCNLNA